MIYAGVGSRMTPLDVQELMAGVASRLAQAGAVLRTGGSSGADAAFLRGALLVPDAKAQVFLPWQGFNGHRATEPYVTLGMPRREAYEIATVSHPFWARCTSPVRKLLARNAHIALGVDLKSPADMLITWTPDWSLDGRGGRSGGAGHCLRVLLAHNPDAAVCNLAVAAHRDHMESFASGRLLDVV